MRETLKQTKLEVFIVEGKENDLEGTRMSEGAPSTPGPARRVVWRDQRSSPWRAVSSEQNQILNQIKRRRELLEVSQDMLLLLE